MISDISALFCVLYAEPLANMIRTNENIRGIPLSGGEYLKVLQYLDDMVQTDDHSLKKSYNKLISISYNIGFILFFSTGVIWSLKNNFELRRRLPFALSESHFLGTYITLGRGIGSSGVASKLSHVDPGSLLNHSQRY